MKLKIGKKEQRGKSAGRAGKGGIKKILETGEKDRGRTYRAEGMGLLEGGWDE